MATLPALPRRIARRAALAQEKRFARLLDGLIFESELPSNLVAEAVDLVSTCPVLADRIGAILRDVPSLQLKLPEVWALVKGRAPVVPKQ